jgi:hypothetical protein
MADGLSSGTEFLRNAAVAYFENVYEKPPIQIAAEVDPKLNWKPTIRISVNDHLMLLAEVSEVPYPLIFRLRRTDVLQLQVPIAIYCVCPEEAYLQNQPDVRDLRQHGYGLLTVSAEGAVQKRFASIPIVQQISEGDFKAEILGLPPKLRRRVATSFELYNHSAPAGVADVTEVVEGVVLKAAREAVRKGWIRSGSAKPGQTAASLAAMSGAAQFGKAAAAVGGAQSYVSRYRNTAHHFPKNKKQAHTKYRDCRHAFLDGLKVIQHFRTAMRNLQLSGSI